MSIGRTRVLVIDDNADLRELIRGALEREGFEVACAANGVLGLQSQRSDPARVVVIDIFMPEKEGIETLVALRKEFPGTKIVVMSGGGSKTGVDYLSVAVEIGAAKSFSKPFDLQSLSNTVRELASAPLS